MLAVRRGCSQPHSARCCGSDRPHDRLASYTILLAWSAARGTLGRHATARLIGLAGREPAAAAHAFARALNEPLCPVLWLPAGLLTSEETCVRRCQGHGCGYFFVDATANRSRRFGSSEGCGNRARARRFHRRHRA